MATLIYKNAVIFFIFFFKAAYQTVVKEAIAEYHKHTCLRFVERTNQQNWLLFVHKSG